MVGAAQGLQFWEQLWCYYTIILYHGWEYQQRCTPCQGIDLPPDGPPIDWGNDCDWMLTCIRYKGMQYMQTEEGQMWWDSASLCPLQNIRLTLQVRRHRATQEKAQPVCSTVLFGSFKLTHIHSLTHSQRGKYSWARAAHSVFTGRIEWSTCVQETATAEWRRHRPRACPTLRSIWFRVALSEKWHRSSIFRGRGRSRRWRRRVIYP